MPLDVYEALKYIIWKISKEDEENIEKAKEEGVKDYSPMGSSRLMPTLSGKKFMGSSSL